MSLLNHKKYKTPLTAKLYFYDKVFCKGAPFLLEGVDVSGIYYVPDTSPDNCNYCGLSEYLSVEINGIMYKCNHYADRNFVDTITELFIQANIERTIDDEFLDDFDQTI